ncbi:MAG: hypothetical protein EA409_11880 [Saprospirales bacterium]|nr:MAG: hypothetical protein EA409_11880 [Saprospirales bacterium]
MHIKWVLVLIGIWSTYIAQAGNDPCNAIFLTPDMLEFESFTIGSGSSGLPNPSCGDYHGTETWFEFTAPPGGDVAIQLLEGSITNAAFSLYTGDCSSPVELHCTDNYLCGESDMPAWFFENLQAGATYYIRVWNEDGAQSGDLLMIIANPSGNPYITTGDATNASFQGYSNCIQLTAAANNQVGCAWYPDPVDFNEPFEHNFNIYLGTISGQAGADGMAIIYQINDIPTCGAAGGGLGVMGIPNSWIIEFDTYQNGPPFIDPVQDHTAISINGDLTFHPSGPVELGFISNGEFHNVTCTWDPTQMRFRVWFNDILVHDLVYDIVNNAFGGQHMAYWGVTASTGGSINQHVLCFDNFEIENLADVYSFQEFTICSGESVFLEGAWQTESGTYIDIYPASNGCDSIVTTELTVLPPIETTHLEATICPGESIFFDGNLIDQSGLFEAIYINDNGCDSLVVLTVIAPQLEGDLIESGVLNCEVEQISIVFEIYESDGELTYFWNTFDGNIVSGFGEPEVFVDEPGIYTLEIYTSYEGFQCGPFEYSIWIDQDTSSPIAIVTMEGELGCEGGTVILDASESQNAHTFEWWAESGGNIVSGHDESIAIASSAGLYLLILTNQITGCQTVYTVEIEQPDEVPLIAVNAPDSLSCLHPAVWINGFGSEAGDQIIYSWRTENGHIASPADSIAVKISSPGIYFLEVMDTSTNCRSEASLEVEFFDDTPEVNLHSQDTIDCRRDSAHIQLTFSGNPEGFILLFGQAEGLSNIPAVDTSIMIGSGGWYFFELSIPSGSCHKKDSIFIPEDFELPTADAGEDATIDCADGRTVLSAQANDEFEFWWTGDEGGLVSSAADSSQINVSQSGLYILEVTLKRNGCTAVDSVRVFADQELPDFVILQSNPIDCNNPIAQLSFEMVSSELDSVSHSWFFEATDSIISENESIDVSREGTYILRVTNEENQCFEDRSLQIVLDTLPPALLIEKSGDLACNQTEVELNIVTESDNLQMFEIIWSYEGEEVPNYRNKPTIFVQSGGTYTVELKNLINGCVSTDLIEVEEFWDPPVFSASVDSILNCRNEWVTIEVVLEESDTTVIFDWRNADGEWIESGINLLEFNVQNQGWYHIVATDPFNGCNFSDSILVASNFEMIEFSLSKSEDILDCRIDSLLVNIETEQESAIIDITWIGQDGLVLTNLQGETWFWADEAGFFLAEIEHEISGCISSESISIEMDRLPPEFELDSAGELNCDSDFVQLLVVNQPGNVPLEYLWKFEGDSLSDASEITVESEGGYSLILKNLINGCTDSNEIEIERLGYPIESILFDLIQADCRERTGFFKVTEIIGGTAPYQLAFENQFSENLFWDNLPPGSHLFEVIDKNGCSAEINIQIEEIIEVTVTLPPHFVIQQGDEVRLRPVFNKPQEEISIIEWQPEELVDCADCFETFISPSENTVVEISVQDINYCLASATTFIEVVPNRDVFIPNAFSPTNRDGINDYFFPLSKPGSVEVIEQFKVFDRWGNRVFSRTNLNPEFPDEGWDGTFKGDRLSNGLFVYLIHLRWKDGEESILSGEINLID